MTARRTALVTGASGQDGRFASRLLLKKGYRVVGTSRESGPTIRIEDGVDLRHCSLRSFEEIQALVADVQPDEIYNFAAFSTGRGMFDDPLAIGDVNGQGPLRFLEAIRTVNPSIRFCQASSSEMFGPNSPSPQTEETPFDPRSPYATAKHYAHNMVGIYRAVHRLFACSAILFNHESELRSTAFVTRKITRSAAMIAQGLADGVTLGNLDARRDWGFAADHVRAMCMMLQAQQPSDFIVATGESHSIRELAEIAFDVVDLDYRDYVKIDSGFQRPKQESEIVGNPAKLRTLGWRPEVTFKELIERMVHADMAHPI